MPKRLELLDNNEWNALLSALANYTDGRGMPLDDEDEDTLDGIYNRLAAL